jgi:CTD small phosphatase-like protein 2
MVLVDNNTYSFGVNLENGVPVHNFTTDKKDCELKYLQRYLEEMAAVEDVREFNRERLGLREMLECYGLPVGVAFGQRQEAT